MCFLGNTDRKVNEFHALVGADDPVRPAVGLFSLSLLHFSRFCGILGVFNLTLKEFSPWKP